LPATLDRLVDARIQKTKEEIRAELAEDLVAEGAKRDQAIAVAVEAEGEKRNEAIARNNKEVVRPMVKQEVADAAQVIAEITAERNKENIKENNKENNALLVQEMQAIMAGMANQPPAPQPPPAPVGNLLFLSPAQGSIPSPIAPSRPGELADIQAFTLPEGPLNSTFVTHEESESETLTTNILDQTFTKKRNAADRPDSLGNCPIVE
jgi:hypothetical protein